MNLGLHIALCSATAPCTFQRFAGSVINGCCPPKANATDGSGTTYAGSFVVQQGCEDACAADATCRSYTWQNAHPYGEDSYANLCYHRHDDTFTPTTYPAPGGHFSARKCAPPLPGKPRYTPDWCSVTQHPTPSWFSRAKFGIYAHFGPYSVPAFGTEWYSRK